MFSTAVVETSTAAAADATTTAEAQAATTTDASATAEGTTAERTYFVHHRHSILHGDAESRVVGH